PGLDADSRRVAGSRVLDRGGHVRPRLQAVPGGGRDDGRARHGRALAGEPAAVPAGSLREDRADRHLRLVVPRREPAGVTARIRILILLLSAMVCFAIVT